MRIGAMFSDIFASLFKKPVTELYPFEKSPAPERYRGKLIWDPGKCTGCQLCVKDCPSDAIELIILDRAKKQFILRYHIDRCTFCAQCVVNCRPNCLSMSPDDWELAATRREQFTVYYGRDEDVNFYLARAAGRLSDTSKGE